MDIHEYQAKRLLHSYGAPIANGVAIYSLEQAKVWLERLAGPPYVIKSQIHAGGRGRGHFKEDGAKGKGGVRIAQSKEEAYSHIKDMLGKHLITKQTGVSGKIVRRIYIEEVAQIEKELYLSLLVDRNLGRVVFVASVEGGMDIEMVAAQMPSKIHKLAVDPVSGFSEEGCVQLCSLLQFEGVSFSDGLKLFPLLYKAFIEKDMSLLEINPLVILKDGHLRLLDAKISFDKNALFRHPDIQLLRDVSEEDPKEVEASQYDLSYIALDGTVGCMVNGAGLAMATMDIVKLHGEAPANFLDVGGSATKDRIYEAFKIISRDQRVKGILVNIFGGIMRCDIIAHGLVAAVKELGLLVPLVVRLEGTNVSLGRDIIAASGLDIVFAQDLEDAARKIVSAVRGG